MKKKLQPLIDRDGEVRELTAADMKLFRPMREVDPGLVKRFKAAKKSRGRPAGRTKAVISLSIDKDVLELLRKSPKGWQTRLNDLLRAAVGLTVEGRGRPS